MAALRKQRVYNMLCSTCGICFPSSNYYENLCATCLDVNYKLHHNCLEEQFINNKYKLDVTYEVAEESHDGYCSDPGDKSDKSYETKMIFPLLNIFKNTDLDDDNEIDIDNKKLIFYKINDKIHGNGYCGMKTTYNIIKAVVKETKRTIDLDS